MKKGRGWLWLIPVGVVVIGAVIATAHPRWIHRVVQVVESDGASQSDEKWFAYIPISNISRDKTISVTKPLLGALAQVMKHQPGVDTVHADYVMRYVYPRKSGYVRLNVDGNLKAIFAGYSKQLTGVRSSTFSGGGLLAESVGKLPNGTEMTLELWDSSVKGGAPGPTKGEISFSWSLR